MDFQLRASSSLIFCCGRLFVSTKSPEQERAGARPAKISSPLVRSVGGSLSARASVPQLARLAALFHRRGVRPAKDLVAPGPVSWWQPQCPSFCSAAGPSCRFVLSPWSPFQLSPTVFVSASSVFAVSVLRSCQSALVLADLSCLSQELISFAVLAASSDHFCLSFQLELCL
jgi:hypothetical protein